MDTLEDRKIFQKTVYLIQAFEISLGFEFNWYIHGVYSPELADAGHDLEDIYSDVSKMQFKDAETERRFENFLDFVEPIKTDVNRLEASSSLHFVKMRNRDVDKDLIIQFVLQEKDFGEDPYELCEEEWDRLQEYDVFE